MAKGDNSGLYRPEDFSGTPDSQSINVYLQRELTRIASAFAFGGARHMDQQSVAPLKPRDGDIAFADGVLWNPGSGIGAYIFYAGSWHVFGGTGPTGATGSQGPIGRGLDGDDGADGQPMPGSTGPAGGTGQPGPLVYAVLEEPEPVNPIPGPQGPVGPPGQVGGTGAPGWVFEDDPEALFPMPGAIGVTGAQGPMGPVILPPENDAELVPYGYNIAEANPTAVVTPAVPATGVAIRNATGRDVTVYIKGGTLTAITVGGVATGIAAAAAANTAHTVPVMRNQSISITYTVAPTWVWIDR